GSSFSLEDAPLPERIVVSPGVPWDIPVLVQARALSMPCARACTNTGISQGTPGLTTIRSGRGASSKLKEEPRSQAIPRS
ncbi:MAG TPA: hypothetical protein DD761_14545, partial [Cyanobacteria bacterium UBA11691]|nr:hypothetical protein [Cyanobacteria bacterium UBA11691]